MKEEAVDLIILDMMMQPGVNGYETYLEAAKIKPMKKALIASGYSASDDVLKTLEQGAGLLIKKSYSVAQMGKAVKDILNNE